MSIGVGSKLKVDEYFLVQKVLNKEGKTMYRWVREQIIKGLVEEYGNEVLQGKPIKEQEKSLVDIIRNQKIVKIR